MNFANKGTSTAAGQRKSRKPVIVAAAVTGLLVPALAVSSPAMAAQFGHTVGHAMTDQLHSVWHLPPLHVANRIGQNQHGGPDGRPGWITPPVGHGRGTGGPGTDTPTTGTGTPTTGTGTPTTGTGTGTGTPTDGTGGNGIPAGGNGGPGDTGTPAPTPTPTISTPAPTHAGGSGDCACYF